MAIIKIDNDKVHRILRHAIGIALGLEEPTDEERAVIEAEDDFPAGFGSPDSI